MEIQAIEFIQNDISMYFFIATAKFLYDNFDVSRRIENKEKGYQRSFSKTKVNSIERYIKNENGIIPNSILVNIDRNCKYENYKLIFDEKENSSFGLIIDGQHRLKGTYQANPLFLLPVIATWNLDVKIKQNYLLKSMIHKKGYQLHCI